MYRKPISHFQDQLARYRLRTAFTAIVTLVLMIIVAICLSSRRVFDDSAIPNIGRRHAEFAVTCPNIT